MLLILDFVAVFVIGAAVGSFVNVCVHRLPYEKSLLWPGSRCGSCFQPVHLYDNIPLVSYWVLRGRCRSCGARFSSQYFLVELFTGLAFVGLLYLVVALLYRWLPSRHLPLREILPGAAVTVVLWVTLAGLFSWYLQNLGRFTVTYGSLGGIVVTLLFFYLSATIFVFGAEINSARRRAEAARLRAERAAERGEVHPG